MLDFVRTLAAFLKFCNHAAVAKRGDSMNTRMIFTVVARIEALTWLGLLIGMFLKYVTETTELGVWLFGRVHGFAFIVYFFVAIFAGLRLRWPWWATLLAVMASIPPLVTFPLELWYRKMGLLGAQGSRDVEAKTLQNGIGE
tara:strand:- start:457 stop:882 length:426 start_codon:yes stop_codon:yes gene_type:complete